VHLTAKFHRRTFNRSEVIVFTNKQTDKQTPLKTSPSLRYATPVGNNHVTRKFVEYERNTHVDNSLTPIQHIFYNLQNKGIIRKCTNTRIL